MKLLRNIIFVLSLGLLFSCNSFLETMPDSSIDIEIDTKDKIRELISGAYPSASYFPFLEPRTDNVAEIINGENVLLNQAMYKWQDFEQDDLDTPLNYWNSCYKGISQVNHALEYLSKQPKTKEIKTLYAEAFLLRAYLHFMLVNIWALPYNGEESINDKGIPYVTNPEKNALVNYNRISVKEVYDKIEKDLQYGLSVVDDKYYDKPKYHFNKLAAYAFASRFYLYKGDWDKVIAYSNLPLGSNAGENIRDWAKYWNKYVIANNGNMGAFYSSTDEPSNLLITTTESRWNRNYRREKYGLTVDIAENIFRRGFTLTDKKTTWVYFYNGSNKYPNMQVIDKFSEYTKFDISGVNPRGIYVNNVLFSLDEALLNRAEAYIMKKQYYLGISDLQSFIARKKLYHHYTYDELKTAFPNAQRELIPFYNLNGIQASLVKVITELRRKEFIHEGMRWFDIRRFRLVVDRNKTGEEFSGDKILSRTDNRKVLQIPSQAIKLGIEQNHR